MSEGQHQLLFLYTNENDLQNLYFYVFSMVVEPEANTVAIASAVKKRIKGAHVTIKHGKQLEFQLPSSESNKFGGKICYTNQTAGNEINLLSFRCVCIFSLKLFSHNVSMRL